MQAYRLPLVTLFFALLSIVLLPAVNARDQLVSRHQHARMIKLWGPPPAARRDLLNGLGLGGSKDGNDSGSSNSAGGAGAGNVAAAPTPSAGGSGTASAPGGTASPPSAGAGAPTSSPATGAAPSAPADSNNGGGAAAPGGANAGGNGGNNNDNGGGGLGGIVGSLSSGIGGIITGNSTPQQTPSGTQSAPPTDTGTGTGSNSASQTPSATPSPTTPVAPVSPVSGVDATPSVPTTDTPPETQSSPAVTLTPEEQQHDEDQSKIPHSTQVILIAVGSSIVAAGIIWTLIRKWKFRASRDRLATIDWAPDNSGNNMEDRQRLSFISQRSGSAADAQSQFHRGNMFAPDAPSAAPDFPPPHDFTAGPMRGTTPQPGLQRGYSGNRGQYGY